MFVIRQATNDDHAPLIRLAGMLERGGRPAESEDVAPDHVQPESFAGRVQSNADRLFVFVLEDTETGGPVGMSAIRSCAGRPGEPLTYLAVRKREHYSEDLRTGQVHVTLQVGTDETPSSELAGLILSPPYRGHRQRLGELLNVVRFHFIGLHREWFAESVVTALPPPVAPQQRGSLWEHLGRRFINLRYEEADRFRMHSREFITALFPRDEIFVSLLPPTARNLIGRVAKEAEPAQRGVEEQGMKYHDRIEPFGGGPILEARIDDLELPARSRTLPLGDPAPEYPSLGIVSLERAGDFRAARVHFADHGNCISISGDAAGLLGAQVGDTVGVTAL